MLELTLRENAYNFLNESMRNARRAEEEDDIHWTFAIVNAAQAIELLLKERLRREHHVLVFSNIDKSGTNTVSLDGALTRLQRCGVVLDPEDITRLQAAKKLRNEVVHYEVSVAPDQIQDAFIDLFEFAHSFHFKELGEELHPHLDPDLWELEAELMEKFRSQVVMYEGDAKLNALPLLIIRAQGMRYYKGQKGIVDRIPYSSESWFDSSYSENCPECSVLIGQLHLPCCHHEQCPHCDGVTATCGCELDERPEPYPNIYDGMGISFTRQRKPIVTRPQE
ncbi:hypothetical protein ACLQ3H_27635 [Micromonospora saelicesensis]|uniref:hypothetical protein n=1 Tax=Micromonospora saelicesensis TaxID=285676 RepID=UPI003CEA28F5